MTHTLLQANKIVAKTRPSSGFSLFLIVSLFHSSKEKRRKEIKMSDQVSSD